MRFSKGVLLVLASFLLICVGEFVQFASAAPIPVAGALEQSALLSQVSARQRHEVCHDVDCPEYKIRDDLGNDVELRRYPAAKWVVTDVDESSYEKATIVGFNRLARYLFGHNELEQRIDMTAPVVTTVRLDRRCKVVDDFTVSLFLPYEFQPDPGCKSSSSAADKSCSEEPVPANRRRYHDDEPPAPRDGCVRTVKLGEVDAYVLPFGGYAMGYRVKRLALDFMDYLERNGAKHLDRTNFLVAVYDPPYKWAYRHNEIWILKKSRKAETVAPAA